MKSWQPTIKLVTPGKATFDAVYPEPTEETQGPGPAKVSIIRLGVMHERDGKYDEEGNVLKAPTLIPGYHVDLRLREGETLPRALQQYVVTPEKPRHRFAGD